jgi:hypothetical protein
MAHPGGFGASSTPNETQIGYWMDGGEAKLLGALRAAGGPSSYTGDAATIIREWVLDYVEGQTRKAYGVDAIDDSSIGMTLVDRFEKLLEDIVRMPTVYLAMLGVGSALTSNGARLRSYVTHNADDRSIDNGDFEPVFKIGDLKGNF